MQGAGLKQPGRSAPLGALGLTGPAGRAGAVPEPPELYRSRACRGGSWVSLFPLHRRHGLGWGWGRGGEALGFGFDRWCGTPRAAPLLALTTSLLLQAPIRPAKSLNGNIATKAEMGRAGRGRYRGSVVPC